MEFHEKLQQLRKNRGLTQEELAEALYVSRTAISKWESGRGYPSIDSLKELSRYFSVSIDDLLSGDKLLSLAEQENRSNIQNLCGLLFGAVDVIALVLILLPLYPDTVSGQIYSVNLLAYRETTPLNYAVYWGMFLSLAVIGAVGLWLAKSQAEKSGRIVRDISVGLHIFAVLYLAMAREPYAVSVTFLLFIMKAVLLLKWVKAGC